MTTAAETNSERIILTIPSALKREVERIAKDEDRSLSGVARRAVLEYVWRRTCTPNTPSA